VLTINLCRYTCVPKVNKLVIFLSQFQTDMSSQFESIEDRIFKYVNFLNTADDAEELLTALADGMENVMEVHPDVEFDFLKVLV
jgi:hypothetical protein